MGLSAVVALVSATAAAMPVGATNARVRDCTPQEAKQVVSRFIVAFNRGSSARLGVLFAVDDGDGDAGTPSFQWYSTGKPGARLGAAASDRSTLLGYFAARHRLRERLRLLSIDGNGNSNGYFHFAFTISRQASDLPLTKYQGKGAMICSAGSGGRIAVWSVGRAIG
ncbi:MAG: hypothetical protein H0V45_10235 [Actinobacteria bacterium]|nr:hypothetical protein [Actinomycetota bacterium]